MTNNSGNTLGWTLTMVLLEVVVVFGLAYKARQEHGENLISLNYMPRFEEDTKNETKAK